MASPLTSSNGVSLPTSTSSSIVPPAQVSLPVTLHSSISLTSSVFTDTTIYTSLPGSVPSSTLAPTPSNGGTIGRSVAITSQTTSQSPALTTVSPTESPSNGNVYKVTSTPASISRKPSNKDVSGGAVAGVAVGCFVVGAFIAGAILLFLLRRRKARSEQNYKRGTLASTHDAEKGLPAKKRLTRGGVTLNIDDLLPMPVADDNIISELSKIRDNIKNHVRSFYHFDAVAAASVNEYHLYGLAKATGMGGPAITELLLNRSTRSEAIRLYIAWVALSRCAGDSYPNLLPDEIAKMPPVVSGLDHGNSAQTPLFSKWKVISGALLQQRYGRQLQADDSRTGSVDEAIRELDFVLLPFIPPKIDSAQRRKNLAMIMGRSAQLAFLIFSQPGSFQFDFSAPEKAGSLIVFPGLNQTVRDDAQLICGHGRPLLEKEIIGDRVP